MPEIRISVGGRDYDVACQEGEEHYLRAAASLLDNEAGVLAGQIGRLPETRMLLMAGLLLADKTAGVEEQLAQLEERLAAQEALIDELKARPAPPPQRVEVPVIPREVLETFSELAARAESLAEALDPAEG